MTLDPYLTFNLYLTFTRVGWSSSQWGQDSVGQWVPGGGDESPGGLLPPQGYREGGAGPHPRCGSGEGGERGTKRGRPSLRFGRGLHPSPLPPLYDVLLFV